MKVQITTGWMPFSQTILRSGASLNRTNIHTLQVNIGKRCNQACHHCHVESGPNRTENMVLKTVDRLIELLKISPNIHTVDITGGAPELNPHFKYFVTEIRKMGKKVIDRCNLTVLYEEGQENTAEFLAKNGVDIVASLPCYSKENVETQRGKGVFGKSISALQMLNKLGYGKEGSSLSLNLVYNPVGEHLPPEQSKLQADYKIKLKEDFNIEFNNLFTITNMPIKRYLHLLERENKLTEYMQLLIDNFNSEAAENVMCKNLISISYDGEIYDCDFNQMLEMPAKGKPNIFNINSFSEITENIIVSDHCYGCTAGAGSSCGGATV